MTIALLRRSLSGPSSHRWVLLLWELSALNVVFRLSAHKYYAAGYFFALSLALGLLWLGQKYQRPALRYLAAGAIATALVVLGKEVSRSWPARAASHQPTEQAGPATN